VLRHITNVPNIDEANNVQDICVGALVRPKHSSEAS
jgi:hypothetical protein